MNQQPESPAFVPQGNNSNIVFGDAVSASVNAYATTGKMIDAALAYAACGVPIFPLTQEKVPLTSRDPDPTGKFKDGIPGTGGFKKATIDPVSIEEWWGKYPNALIGVPMGERAGVWALDVDTPADHANDGMSALDELLSRSGYELPATRIHASATGGRHILFAHRQGIKCGAGSLPEGMEVKGEGGYIVVPPSRRKQGQYVVIRDAPIAEAPGWLVNLILTDKREGQGRKNFAIPSVPPPDLLAALLAGSQGRGVSIAPEDTRPRTARLSDLENATPFIPNDNEPWDEWNRIGMAIYAATDGTGFSLFDEWSRKSAKYDPRTTKQRWEHYESSPPSVLTAGTIFYLAIQGGWKPSECEAPASVERPAPTDDNPIVEKPKSTGERKNSRVVCAANILMRPKEWLWKGQLLRGAQELLTGIPGLGKSQVQIHFIACVTAGLTWPNGEPGMSPANVLMLTAEDVLDQEIVPRLVAASADLKRVFIFKSIRIDDKNDRQFLLAEDLPKLEKIATEIGNVALITIDPITAYMGGKMDSHKATEVRSQLGPLKDFAERMNVAVSTITHPPKSAGQKAIDHFIGSQAFIAAGRIGHVCVAEMEEDEDGGKKPTGRVLFTNAKNNPHVRMPTLAYRIGEVVVGQDPSTNENIAAPHVIWDAKAVDISADQAVAAAGAGSNSIGGRGEQRKVQGLLVDMLKSGPVAQQHIMEVGRGRGFTSHQLRTAKENLGIRSDKDGSRGWVWSYVV